MVSHLCAIHGIAHGILISVRRLGADAGQQLERLLLLKAVGHGIPVVEHQQAQLAGLVQILHGRGVVVNLRPHPVGVVHVGQSPHLSSVNQSEGVLRLLNHRLFDVLPRIDAVGLGVRAASVSACAARHQGQHS